MWAAMNIQTPWGLQPQSELTLTGSFSSVDFHQVAKRKARGRVGDQREAFFCGVELEKENRTLVRKAQGSN